MVFVLNTLCHDKQKKNRLCDYVYLHFIQSLTLLIAQIELAEIERLKASLVLWIVNNKQPDMPDLSTNGNVPLNFIWNYNSIVRI